MNQTLAKTLVIIDSSVESYQMLEAGLVKNATIGYLAPDQDGVQQITAMLQQYPQIASLHIVSHGSPGALYLGNAQLSLDTLGHYAKELKTWFSSSSASYVTASIHLYGCHVAAGDAGTEFVERLHHLTGVAIAASRTPTGNRALGGNWNLEVTTGELVANSPFDPATLEDYPAILASVAPPKDLTGANATWKDIGSNNPFGTAFGVNDASLLTRNDAYDGGLFLSVDGKYFQTPATIDLTGQTITATNTLAGLNVSVQYQADQTNPILRALYSFQNATSAPITVKASVFTNLGSDGDTVVESSSNGDTSLTAGDRWAITSDQSPTGDPVVTSVFFGPGTPEAAAAFAALFVDSVSATYDITIPANSTRALLLFNELSAASTTAISGSSVFNTNAALTSSGLLSGLSSQQQAEVLNWDFFANTASAPDPIDFSGGTPGETLRGTTGNDTLQGTADNDTILGLGGNDKLSGQAGNDIVRGGGGTDTLNGNGNNDQLFGQSGGDLLKGQGGSDQLDGAGGNDTLLGGNGNDVCIGGDGADTLTGGGGADLFVFRSVTDGVDTITDFTSTEDLIDLRQIFVAPSFSGVTADFRFAQFVQLVQVGANTDVKIDADGNGSGTNFVSLATLTNVTATSIGAGNFVIA